MVNYKHQILKEHVAVGVNDKYHTFLPTGQKLFLLESPTLTGVISTLHQIKDNANYVVPADKVAKIVDIKSWDPNTTSVGVFFQSDDVDASTNPVNMFSPVAGVNWDNLYFMSDEFTAGKYINVTITINVFKNKPSCYILESNA